MSGLIRYPGYTPALTTNGDPIPGARMWVYVNQTTTLASIFSDSALTVPHANPAVADANGQFGQIYAADGSVFSLTVTDALGAVLFGGSRDGVPVATSGDVISVNGKIGLVVIVPFPPSASPPSSPVVGQGYTDTATGFKFIYDPDGTWHTVLTS